MSIRRSLKVVLAASLALTSVAVAGTNATVVLGGNVDSTLAISSTPTSSAADLPLSSGLKIVHVADLVMTTNNDQGISLTASSGSLTHAGGQPIAFQVTTVAEGEQAPAEGAFSVASGQAYSAEMSSAQGEVEHDLYIKYTPAATQDPGAYAGTINLTVSDN